jgi:hypothetical protein
MKWIVAEIGFLRLGAGERKVAGNIVDIYYETWKFKWKSLLSS